MFVMSVITLPLFFLSGAVFPLTQAPGWLRTLAYLDPATYAVDAIRRTLIPSFPAALEIGGRPIPIALDVAVPAGFGGLMFLPAVRGFRRRP